MFEATYSPGRALQKHWGDCAWEDLAHSPENHTFDRKKPTPRNMECLTDPEGVLTPPPLGLCRTSCTTLGPREGVDSGRRKRGWKRYTPKVPFGRMEGFRAFSLDAIWELSDCWLASHQDNSRAWDFSFWGSFGQKKVGLFLVQVPDVSSHIGSIVQKKKKTDELPRPQIKTHF